MVAVIADTTRPDTAARIADTVCRGPEGRPMVVLSAVIAVTRLRLAALADRPDTMAALGASTAALEVSTEALVEASMVEVTAKRA